jgi:hypothetical protein
MSKATSYLVERIREQERIIEGMIAQRASDWDTGFSAAVEQHAIQQRDPSHPFTRDNPFQLRARET